MSASFAVSVINKSASTKKSSFPRASFTYSVSGNIRAFMPQAKIARMGYGVPSITWRAMSMAWASPSSSYQSGKRPLPTGGLQPAGRLSPTNSSSLVRKPEDWWM